MYNRLYMDAFTVRQEAEKEQRIAETNRNGAFAISAIAALGSLVTGSQVGMGVVDKITNSPYIAESHPTAGMIIIAGGAVISLTGLYFGFKEDSKAAEFENTKRNAEALMLQGK